MYVRLLPILIVTTLLTAAPALGEWASVSFGLDMSHLVWERGGSWAWGFQSAFGVMLTDELTLRAKATIPFPFFVVVGNQVSLGGELAWEPFRGDGWSVETSVGAAWSLHWPQHVTVILADGPGEGEARPFDHASGLRCDLLVSPGIRFDEGAIRLDLGYDLRRMNVLWFEDGIRREGIRIFQGPHFGLSADMFF